MNIRRREFIKTAGGIALATVAQSLPAWPLQPPAVSETPIRVAVLYDPTFPSGGITVDQPLLQESLKGLTAEFLGADALENRLRVSGFDLFINPYGSCFPKAAFRVISRFLLEGGNWVNLGGVPLSIPVDKIENAWKQEMTQTAYHKQLGITQAFTITGSGVASYQANPDLDWSRSLLDQFSAEEIYELYVRFTSIRDFPNEDGSAGPRDAVLSPVIHGVDKDQRAIAAPFIEIERFQGEYSGGCWVFAALKGTVTAKAIRAMVDRAARGSMQLRVQPSFASYFPGEIPSFTVQFRRGEGSVEKLIDGDCRIEILDEHGRALKRLNVPLRGTGTIAGGTADGVAMDRLKPGLYEIHASLRIHFETPAVIHYRTGFWVFDESLLKGGKPLTAGNRNLLRDGEPYPVTGTTYMGSDVHRKFLFEPNPYLWNKDFAGMKGAGINMVRTGIWTGWTHYMMDVGAPAEGPLRAMDAFVLTARKFDIPIIFTLFAFLPESWGGVNPYLDPRALNAQKEFVAAIARRYRDAREIIWDLINEPSFCNPQFLWQCRPNYDRYESAAWQKWLTERYPAPSEEARSAMIQEAYRMTSDEAPVLPTREDFDDVNLFGARHPVKVIDYRLFAQEMFTRWVREMSGAIRSVQGAGDRDTPHQLITVGQDEGGTYESPGNQFFGDAVDFTCVHNWWSNDDLLWDQVLTATADRPNLVEETGVMFYEKMDSSPWRNEEEVRNLLERKMAIAIGSGSAGFIQWLWNTNPYMTLDNESGIGFHRVDGTAKPELVPMTALSRFVAAHRTLMRGRKDEDAVMIIPHSQMFSTRNFATDATRRCVRVMSYDLNIPVSAISEYRVGKLKAAPKLLIMPSPRTISQQCWEDLLKLADRGSTLLITGVIDTDDHWLPAQRTTALKLTSIIKPVSEEEFFTLEGTEYHLSFRGEKMQRIEKAIDTTDREGGLTAIPHGAGKIIWCPLPVELSDSVEPTAVLYRYAVRQAGISTVFNIEPKKSGVLVLPSVYDNAMLYTLVSESDRNTRVRLTHLETSTGLNLTVPAQRTAMILVDRKQGEILGRL
jgi:cellulase (glycosyl hydrolase family 5)